MPLELLHTEGVNFSYNGAEVLCDVGFRVEAGDYVGIVGPNGSGKSSLIKVILGLIGPARGEISLFGVPRARFSEWRRIGYLPQRLKFFNPEFPATVEELVRMGLLAGKRFPKRRAPEDNEAVEQALELMGISDIRRSLIGELSGGQQ